MVSNTDLFPTGEQVRDIDAVVDYMLTNIVVVGAAYQHGAIPISAAAIEQAIELNGVAVELNEQAFRYGRLWATDP